MLWVRGDRGKFANRDLLRTGNSALTAKATAQHRSRLVRKTKPAALLASVPWQPRMLTALRTRNVPPLATHSIVAAACSYTQLG